MLGKIQLATQLIKNMGWRYVFFRIKHQVLIKLGLFKLKFPTHKAIAINYSFKQWQQHKIPFLINNKQDIDLSQQGSKTVLQEAQKIKEGYIKFFNNEFVFLGKNYNWITNPDTNFCYDNKKHWTAINDYSTKAGDIKYVWEKSRFSFVYTLLKDELQNQTKHSEFIFSEIDSWINNNPVNQGPNWKCSQETSLRVLNWIYVLYFYSNQNIITEERWQKIMQSIYWQIHHVYGNIHFSRIAVRNNHAITESLALYIVGTLFPFLPNAKNWKQKGKNWFEQEIAYQVYEDGTFLQFSMNYNRVVVQLLSWALQIATANNEKFTNVVYQRSYETLNFLYQCQEGLEGELPNYGSNDGAIFFPFATSNFRDYRPQLNTLHKILTNQHLYNNSESFITDDALWYGKTFNQNYKPLQKQMGVIEFKIGGYYLFRDDVSFTFIRCGNHKDRPHQADNLHIDIWVKGKNVFVDGGSYKYNSNPHDVDYFFGTASHNTIMLSNQNQMQKGSRFIWLHWTQCIAANTSFNNNEFRFIGGIKAFGQLDNRIAHKRTIEKIQNELTWIIRDEIKPYQSSSTITQNWLLHPAINANDLVFQSTAEKQQSQAYYSSEYGSKIKTNQVKISTQDNSIQTIINLDKLA